MWLNCSYTQFSLNLFLSHFKCRSELSSSRRRWERSVHQSLKVFQIQENSSDKQLLVLNFHLTSFLRVCPELTPGSLLLLTRLDIFNVFKCIMSAPLLGRCNWALTVATQRLKIHAYQRYDWYLAMWRIWSGVWIQSLIKVLTWGVNYCKARGKEEWSAGIQFPGSAEDEFDLPVVTAIRLHYTSVQRRSYPERVALSVLCWVMMTLRMSFNKRVTAAAALLLVFVSGAVIAAVRERRYSLKN